MLIRGFEHRSQHLDLHALPLHYNFKDIAIVATGVVISSKDIATTRPGGIVISSKDIATT